ncbi:MAG: PrsW family intramembrane metalloprotease [Polyangiaceae bacterium]
MILVGLVLGALFVTPFVIFYVLVVRWCDRFEPEPWWLLACAFIWGAFFATLGGGIMSSIGEGVANTMTHKTMTAASLDAFGAEILAPICEEGFKGLGVGIIALGSAVWLHELDGPLDGVIYGGIVGLGFTLTEDILYVATQYAKAGLAGFASLLVLRTIFLGLSHCTFTACTGLGFGIAAESKSWFVKILAPLVGYGCAMMLHAIHNTLPTELGASGTGIMILEQWGIEFIFFALLAVLVVRDRAIVVRELSSEVGRLIHPRELVLISTYTTIGGRNWATLFSKGWRAFRDRRHKQLALVELAFVKNRRRRGEFGRDLDMKEAKLRHEIYVANQQGIWLGN